MVAFGTLGLNKFGGEKLAARQSHRWWIRPTQPHGSVGSTSTRDAGTGCALRGVGGKVFVAVR